MYASVSVELPSGSETVTSAAASSVPGGVIAEICVLLSTVNDSAGTPLKVTCVTPVKPEPVIVTGVKPPAGPLVGLMLTATGGSPAGAPMSIGQAFERDAPPVPRAFTRTSPSMMPAGTVTLMTVPPDVLGTPRTFTGVPSPLALVNHTSLSVGVKLV